MDIFIPLINVGSARHVSTFVTTAVLSRAKPSSTISATMVRSLLCQGTRSCCYPEHRGPMGRVQEMLTHVHLLTGTHFCWKREGKPNPSVVCFQFFIEITIKQIASTHFSLSDGPLTADLGGSLGPTFEPLPLPGSPQTLLFSFKLISSFSPRSEYV